MASLQESIDRLVALIPEKGTMTFEDWRKAALATGDENVRDAIASIVRRKSVTRKLIPNAQGKQILHVTREVK